MATAETKKMLRSGLTGDDPANSLYAYSGDREITAATIRKTRPCNSSIMHFVRTPSAIADRAIIPSAAADQLSGKLNTRPASSSAALHEPNTLTFRFSANGRKWA